MILFLIFIHKHATEEQHPQTMKKCIILNELNKKTRIKAFESAISFLLKKFKTTCSIVKNHAVKGFRGSCDSEKDVLEQPIRNQIKMDFNRCVSHP